MTAVFRPEVPRDTLIARGAARDEAERLTDAMTAAFAEDVASRHDLEVLRLELRADLAAGFAAQREETRALRDETRVMGETLRRETVALGEELRRDTATLGAELRRDTAALGAELRQDSLRQGASLRAELQGFKLWIAVGGLTFVLTALNLAFNFWRAMH